MPRYTAKTADRYELYQQSVQDAEAEVKFVDRVYRARHGRRPTRLREDFCGTALVCCAWAQRRRENLAYGVDLHRATLNWGRRNNVRRLKPEAARRVHLLNSDVLHVLRPKVDVVVALNFSYFVFKERSTLLKYFRAARRSLAPGGLFILDAYGGYEAQQVMQERTRCRGFTYVWDQADYNPINDHTTCHIHFEFPDGTRMRRAFTYDWRLWTLGSLQECLTEAGFSAVDVYWEGTDHATNKGNGVFRLCRRAENEAGWIAHLVAHEAGTPAGGR